MLFICPSISAVNSVRLRAVAFDRATGFSNPALSMEFLPHGDAGSTLPCAAFEGVGSPIDWTSEPRPITFVDDMAVPTYI